MQAALELIPARKLLIPVEGAGHELLGKSTGTGLPSLTASAFLRFAGT
jgi:hypothetical protein